MHTCIHACDMYTLCVLYSDKLRWCKFSYARARPHPCSSPAVKIACAYKNTPVKCMKIRTTQRFPTMSMVCACMHACMHACTYRVCRLKCVLYTYCVCVCVQGQCVSVRMYTYCVRVCVCVGAVCRYTCSVCTYCVCVQGQCVGVHVCMMCAHVSSLVCRPSGAK